MQQFDHLCFTDPVHRPASRTAGSALGADVQRLVFSCVECPEMADSGRSSDEIHPWLPNGDLRPTVAYRSSITPTTGLETSADKHKARIPDPLIQLRKHSFQSSLSQTVQKEVPICGSPILFNNFICQLQRTAGNGLCSFSKIGLTQGHEFIRDRSSFFEPS